MRILIVDDEIEILNSISILFQVKYPGAKISTTHSGRNAVDLVWNHHFDIVFLDLNLPDMSGFDVLEEIRLFSNTPVIVMTADSEEAKRNRALSLGANDCLAKPFHVPQLLEHAENLCPVLKNLRGLQSGAEVS